MFDSAAPDHPNPAPTPLALQLPADAYWQLVHTLRLTLPPPPTEGAEDLARRDHAAMARVAALAPANAAEADLAAQFVAASEQWKDCLRLARQPETLPEWAMKCRAQAASMMRQANSALRLLLRMQATREKREADNAACDRAAWTEHCAIGLMAEALAATPAPPAAAQVTPQWRSRPRRTPDQVRGRRNPPRRRPGPTSSPLSAMPPPIPSGPRRSAAPGGCPTIFTTSARPRPRSRER